MKRLIKIVHLTQNHPRSNDGKFERHFRITSSAHGVPKKIPDDAKNYKMTYVDATCPLVSKVHIEAENLNKAGYQIILIGHQNHPEVIGTMGQLPVGAIDLIQNENEAKN